MCARSGPPTYLMKDTKDHEEVEKHNVTNAENAYEEGEIDQSTSSSDDDFVDLDNIVTKPMRESMRESRPVTTC